jgi:hypothetical protein
MLEAGATGVVKAIKVSAKLLAAAPPTRPATGGITRLGFRPRRGLARVAGLWLLRPDVMARAWSFRP